MGKILLIDDYPDTGPLIHQSLRPYFVRQVLNLAEAEVALSEMNYDLILIDVSLPDGSGFDFCLKLSQSVQHGKTPRILITAKDQPSEKAHGFSCGADDYITKPFHPIELKARVDRYLNRQSRALDDNFTHGNLHFHLSFQKCFVVNGQEKTDLDLTPTEFRLLLTLVKNEDKVLSRRMLEQLGWEANGTVIEIRGVDTHIAHLRKKLGALKKTIVSVYGQGYAYAPLKVKAG